VATIKLQSISQKPASLPNGFVYCDMHLDFTPVFGKAPFGAYTQNNELQREEEIIDIKADYNLGAIRNSLLNLFNTVPGQKILNPYFGLNLLQYIFEECSENTAQLIGNQIASGTTTFEPRVTLKKVQVLADPDNHQYVVNIVITVPTLGSSSFQLNGILSTSGFAFSTQ